MQFEYSHPVFSGIESSVKIDGNFLLFASGARIRLNQVQSVSTYKQESTKENLAIVFLFSYLGAMWELVPKWVAGIPQAKYSFLQILVGFALNVAWFYFLYWLVSTGKKYSVMIRIDSGDPWLIEKESKQDAHHAAAILHLQIFTPSYFQKPVETELTLDDVKRDLKELHARGGLNDEEFKRMKEEFSKDENLRKTSNKPKTVVSYQSRETATTRQRPFSRPGFAGIEKSVKIDGDFLLFSSGLRIPSDQITVFSTHTKSSFIKLSVVLVLAALYFLVVAGAFTDVVVGLYSGDYSSHQIIVCLLINAVWCCFLYWLGSSIDKNFLVVNTDTKGKWLVKKKNYLDAEGSVLDLTKQIFFSPESKRRYPMSQAEFVKLLKLIRSNKKLSEENFKRFLEPDSKVMNKKLN